MSKCASTLSKRVSTLSKYAICIAKYALVRQDEYVQSFFAKYIKRVGLRVTKPRIAVLEELADNPHSTAEEVRIGVTKRLGSISTQAVYDVLHALTEKNLLRCIEPQGSVPRYELQRNRNHHHLICRSCYKIIDVKCKDQHPPCLHVDDPHDFTINEAEITFWGFCPKCTSQLKTEYASNVPTNKHENTASHKNTD